MTKSILEQLAADSQYASALIYRTRQNRSKAHQTALTELSSFIQNADQQQTIACFYLFVLADFAGGMILADQFQHQQQAMLMQHLMVNKRLLEQSPDLPNQIRCHLDSLLINPKKEALRTTFQTIGTLFQTVLSEQLKRQNKESYPAPNHLKAPTKGSSRPPHTTHQKRAKSMLRTAFFSSGQHRSMHNTLLEIMASQNSASWHVCDKNKIFKALNKRIKTIKTDDFKPLQATLKAHNASEIFTPSSRPHSRHLSTLATFGVGAGLGIAIGYSNDISSTLCIGMVAALSIFATYQLMRPHDHTHSAVDAPQCPFHFK